MDVIKRFNLLLLSCFLLGCEKDSDESDPPPPELEASFHANVSNGANHATVAASLRHKGERVQMIGGDIFVASNTQGKSALVGINESNGDYLATLPFQEGDQTVHIEVEHDAIAASQGRWYPVDILQVDPGPGEYIGKFGEIRIPSQAVTITAPEANSQYSDVGQNITLEWDISNNPTGELYTTRLVGVGRCSNGGRTHYAYHSLSFDDDPGTATILLEDVVFNPHGSLRPSTISDFIFGLTLGFFHSMFSRDADDLDNYLDFEAKRCDIDLTVFRELKDNSGEDFDAGYAVGSRSATLKLEYQAP